MAVLRVVAFLHLAVLQKVSRTSLIGPPTLSAVKQSQPLEQELRELEKAETLLG